MNKYIYRLSAGLLPLLSLLTLFTGCSDNMDIPADNGEGIALSLKGLSRAGADPSEVGELNIYQFNADHLLRHISLKDFDPKAITLGKGSTSSLYCVAGTGLKADANTAPTAFSKSTISTDEDSAPLFYSGYAEVGESQNSCELTMSRGVARIDLDARDAEMEISEIIVEDAPAASYVFNIDGSKLDAGKAAYSHTFDSAPTGIETGLFMIFESAKDVHVKVRGIARGAEIEVPAVLTSVERNKVYTLRVYDRNVLLSASFSVSDWEEGATIDAGPDTAHSILIDEAASVIPEGVTVDYARNLIEVPASGVSNMTLAFNTDLRVDLDSVLLIGERVVVDSVREKYVKVAKHSPETTPTGVVTKFTVDISEQLKARPGYEIKLELRKPNLAISCDNVTIRVAESPYQIQTVKMAGLTWMAFNATTPDLSDQIFPLPGKTVEETYQEAWVSTIGNFFQYGRQKWYNPWERCNPNGNPIDRDLPWTSPECMPLPEGYHVATSAEWTALLPSGTQIPSTYTAGNGETIKVEVVEYPGLLDDAPCVAANNAKLRKRCIRFESQETGNVLLFPVCGMKSNTQDLYPGAGRSMDSRVVYWIAEDRNVWFFGITNTDGVLGASQSQDKWNYDGFVATRGVKNK